MESLPPGDEHPDGEAALELVEAAGIILDPWQARKLKQSLRQRAGKWAAFEVGLVCPRQNGKNELIIARELAGLFVLGERLIIHSAHQFDTSLEAFRRLVQVVEENDWLMSEVRGPNGRGIKRSHGEEGIELKNGSRIRFRTRTKGGGRGFSGDCVIFDEAMIFPEASLGAILPIVSARPNPQVWYTGSAVDQLIHDDGRVLSRIRDRGLRGDDESLYYSEWSAPGSNPDDFTAEDARNREYWALGNPALGIRISEEHIANELRSMDPRTFAVEREGVGDWFTADGGTSPIDLDKWVALEDRNSRPLDPVCFAFDVSPGRTWASVTAAGYRSDGKAHVEVVRRDRGTGWVVDYIAEISEKHKNIGFLCDSIGPAGTLIHELEQKRVKVIPINSGEHALACGLLLDWVEQSRLRHLGTPELEAAIRGADKRPMLDKWAWARKSSAVDITPLVAATFAVWGLSALNPPPKEPMVAWV